jgi:hypothetical protein
MPKVCAAPLPKDSLLNRYVAPGDFTDCFTARATVSVREAAQIATQFPEWSKGLLKLRNLIVAPFGLATSGSHEGETFGIFPLLEETDDEMILGIDDSHLDFRISLMSDGQSVTMSTWVKTHHLGGKIYLNGIMPFHKLIVRSSVARVAQAYPPLATV